jgi:histidinol-phosphate aminotransferase
MSNLFLDSSNGKTLFLSIILVVFLAILFHISILNKKKHTRENFISMRLFKRELKDTENNNLENPIYKKTILITASTSGFGYKLAENMAKYPVNIFITGKHPQKVDDAIANLQKINPNVYGKSAFFSDEKEVERMFEAAVKKFKTIDIVINIPVKIYNKYKLSDTSVEKLKETLNKNLESAMQINNLAIAHMSKKSLMGRIINVSNFKSKHNSTKTAQGAEILTNNIIENYSKLLASEVYGKNIAVILIRLDEDISGSQFNFNFPIKPNKKGEQLIEKIRNVNNLLRTDPKTMFPLFIHAIKAPFNEVTGKVLSSNSFKQDKELQKLVSPNIMNQNKDSVTYMKNTQIDKDSTVLYKQNPFNPPEKAIQKIKKLGLSGMNVNNAYRGELEEILAKKNKTLVENIILFRSENDALKKLYELFIPKKSNIIIESPSPPSVILFSREKNIENRLVTLDKKEEKNNTYILPDLEKFKNNINEKTKMIYISSPNTVSGASIKKKEFTEFMDFIPNNIIVLLDQRYFDLSFNKDKLDGASLVNNYKNLIVLRSINNTYNIESLTIGFLITNKTLSTFIKEKHFINEIDPINEKLAVSCLDDTDYNKELTSKIKKEYNRFTKQLTKNNIDFYPSETNFLLIDSSKPYKETKEDLKKLNIVLYESNDQQGTYWTLPLSTPKVNNKVLNVLNYK